MAKLYFHYSTMNAGKSTLLLQASYNYRERGMETLLITARFDDRAGDGRIGSRIGIGERAETFAPDTDLFALIASHQAAGPLACVFIDEAQFLTSDQVWQLARAVDDLGLPVMCYGLRVDFRGALFPGSAALLAWADEMREVRTICHCGKKATMVVRKDAAGRVLRDGEQVQIGGNESYVSLCRRHWREAVTEAGTETVTATAADQRAGTGRDTGSVTGTDTGGEAGSTTGEAHPLAGGDHPLAIPLGPRTPC